MEGDVGLDDAEDLPGYEVALRARHHLKTIQYAEEKWTQCYLDDREIGLLRALKSHPRLTRLQELGDVDVGIVTGSNAFFVLTEEQVRLRDLADHTLPLVGRTAQLPGLSYSEEDWKSNQRDRVLCHLLNLPAVPFDVLPEAAKKYVQAGEALGTHTGFKCRNRKLWYIVPTLRATDAFLFRQIHGYPKVVQNRTAATSTDTIHRVRFRCPEDAPQISVVFLDPMTFALSFVPAEAILRTGTTQSCRKKPCRQNSCAGRCPRHSSLH